MALQLRQQQRCPGARFQLANENQFQRDRLPRQYSFTLPKAGEQQWRLGPAMVIHKPAVRLSDRDDDARETAAGPAGRKDQFVRACLTLLLLFSDVHHHYDAWYRASSDELFLSCRRLFLLSLAARLSGGSRL